MNFEIHLYLINRTLKYSTQLAYVKKLNVQYSISGFCVVTLLQLVISYYTPHHNSLTKPHEYNYTVHTYTLSF